MYDISSYLNWNPDTKCEKGCWNDQIHKIPLRHQYRLQGYTVRLQQYVRGSKCMQSAPINMLVVVVGLIGGSIHVLPPPHISPRTSSPAIISVYHPNVPYHCIEQTACRCNAFNKPCGYTQDLYTERGEFFGWLSMSRSSWCTASDVCISMHTRVVVL
jgi:hypothetical protein